MGAGTHGVPVRRTGDWTGSRGEVAMTFDDVTQGGLAMWLVLGVALR
jgi:hypothetical protein